MILRIHHSSEHPPPPANHPTPSQADSKLPANIKVPATFQPPPHHSVANTLGRASQFFLQKLMIRITMWNRYIISCQMNMNSNVYRIQLVAYYSFEI